MPRLIYTFQSKLYRKVHRTCCMVYAVAVLTLQVIQRRINGQYNFHLGWQYYKNGIGTPQAKGEFWLG